MSNKVGKILQIDWEDAWSHSGKWTLAEIQNSKPLIVSLYGYCVRDDKSGIALAMESMNSDDFRNVWFVPRGMIRKVSILK